MTKSLWAELWNNSPLVSLHSTYSSKLSHITSCHALCYNASDDQMIRPTTVQHINLLLLSDKLTWPMSRPVTGPACCWHSSDRYPSTTSSTMYPRPILSDRSVKTGKMEMWYSQALLQYQHVCKESTWVKMRRCNTAKEVFQYSPFKFQSRCCLVTQNCCCQTTINTTCRTLTPR